MDLNETRAAARGHRPPAPDRPAAVRLEIGELALHGLGPAVDPDLVAAVFRTELSRLLQKRGLPLADGEHGRVLDALTGLPPLPATGSPARLGRALAEAVHAGLAGRAEGAGRDGTPAAAPPPGGSADRSGGRR